MWFMDIYETEAQNVLITYHIPSLSTRFHVLPVSLHILLRWSLRRTQVLHPEQD